MSEELLRLIREFPGTLTLSYQDSVRAYRVRVRLGEANVERFVSERQQACGNFDILTCEIGRAMAIVQSHQTEGANR